MRIKNTHHTKRTIIVGGMVVRYGEIAVVPSGSVAEESFKNGNVTRMDVQVVEPVIDAPVTEAPARKTRKKRAPKVAQEVQDEPNVEPQVEAQAE